MKRIEWKITIIALTVVLVICACSPRSAPEEKSVGMGDVHSFENLSVTYVGMGDVRSFESQVFVPVTGRPPYVGMGDLHFFESQH